jgi:hypothetical protein
MSDLTSNVDRVLDLAGAVCDERASRDDFVELDSIVVADETSRRYYWGYCWMHVTLGMDARVHRALQKVRERDNLDSTALSPWEADTLKAMIPPAVPAPSCSAFPTFLDANIPGVVGYFSSDWSLSYLIATVICGIAGLIGSLIYVSRCEQVVDNSPSRAVERQLAPLPKVESVGRITGMVDCKWARGSYPLVSNDGVSLGRELKIESGLVEIGYNTGAKVILQGPVAYVVESKNGGFMSVGKLTGKVTTKSAKGFAVRTPTATVTDLGTEFGVEVRPDRQEDVVVLQGQVQVAVCHAQGDADQVQTLQAGQSAQINGKTAALVVGDMPTESSRRFVRALPILAAPREADVAASANLVLWLRADAIRGISDGTPVGVWSDNSTRHNHLYRVTPELPVYISGASSGLNNMPVVRFNGAQQLRGVLDTDPRTPGVQTLNTPFTLISVVRNAGSSGIDSSRSYFGGGDLRLAFSMGCMHENGPRNVFLAWTPNGSNTYGQPKSVDTNWNVHAYTLPDLTPRHWTCYCKGTAAASIGLSSIATQQFGENVYVGGSGADNEYWIGDIAEILIYDRVLTKAEIDQVGSYFARKYGIGTAWAISEPAKKKITTFDTRSAWNAQTFTAGPTSVDLAALCPLGAYVSLGDGSAAYPNPWFKQNGVWFANEAWGQYILNNAPGMGAEGLGPVVEGWHTVDEVLTFPTGTNSVALDMTGLAAGYRMKATLLLSDATTQVWDVMNDAATTPAYKTVFVGATAAPGVTVASLTIAGDNVAGYDRPVIGNVAYGIANVPSTTTPQGAKVGRSKALRHVSIISPLSLGKEPL